MIRFHYLFVSPGHNYFGHPGGSPGDRSVIEADPIKCVAGRGMRNDRLFGQFPDQCGKTVGTRNDLLVGNVYTDLTFGRFNVIAEYLYSSNENGARANLDASSYGFWVQPSYKFDKHWEADVCYSYTDTDGRGINLSDSVRSAPSGGTMDKLTNYYVGFTYYLSGNDLKIQAGYVYGEAKDIVTGGKAKTTTSGIRSQMQIQF